MIILKTILYMNYKVLNHVNSNYGFLVNFVLTSGFSGSWSVVVSFPRKQGRGKEELVNGCCE